VQNNTIKNEYWK